VRPSGQRIDDEQSSARYRLAAILGAFAKQDGDVDAGIAIRAKDLATAYDYLGIAQLCLANQRHAEATKWAEEGLWQFEDHPDERLVFFTADLYGQSGRQTDATILLWRTFEQLPSIALYRALKKSAGGQRASMDAARDRAIALLRGKLGQSAPRELLLQVLMTEKLFVEAWQVVGSYGATAAQLLALAQASEQSHPDEALTAYGQEADRLAVLGGQTN
jgi:hypothetical protein